MNLNDIQKPTPKPARIIIYGNSGVGKTTIASQSDRPIFLCTEDGLGNLNVPSFPLIQDYDQFISALSALGREEHDFQTVVIDSLDWLEPLVWAQVCKRLNVKSIEEPGYGKGYTEATVEWTRILDYLTALRDHKGMTVILLAHSQVVRIEDPIHPPYDSHGLKLHKRASAKVSEYADVVGYATVKTLTKVDDAGFGSKRTRAISTGERVLHTTGNAAYLAKNRYGIPDPLPLSWEELAKHLPQTPPKPQPKTGVNENGKTE